MHFNIGVTAFRLGRYDQAEEAFLETARTPSMAALAHYNLGLVALRRNKTAAATRWFTRAQQEATDERLRALATARLDALPPPPDRSWAGYASLGAGYDDNVALVSQSDVLGVSGVDDTFAEMMLAVSGPLAGAWRADASLVLLDFQELDSFDQLSAQGGARYRARFGEWAHDVALQLAHATLDGEAFENRRILALQASRDLWPGWRARARYRFSDIDGMNEFEGIGGQRHEVDGRLEWVRGPWDVGLGYQLEIGDQDDEALSATRHEIGIRAWRQLRPLWSVAVEARLRHSQYDLDSNGDEDRFELGLVAARALTARWHLTVRYDYADNSADRPEFNYERNRVGATIEATF